jgi:hypothetical protein
VCVGHRGDATAPRTASRQDNPPRSHRAP